MVGGYGGSYEDLGTNRNAFELGNLATARKWNKKNDLGIGLGKIGTGMMNGRSKGTE